jgi:hypothetical protein
MKTKTTILSTVSGLLFVLFILNLYYLIIDFFVMHSLSSSVNNRNYYYSSLICSIFISNLLLIHCYFRPIFDLKNHMNFIIASRTPTKKGEHLFAFKLKYLEFDYLDAGAANCLSSTSITPRTALAEAFSNSDSSLLSFNSIICSIPFLPSLTGTPR